MAGRPREFDRDEALKRARDLFWTRGYEGVSMADLVAELGLASARIYAAFGSKEALFREAVAHYQAHEGGFVDRILSAEPDLATAIRAVFREAATLYTRPGRAQGCMVVSAATNVAVENRAIADALALARRRQTAAFTNRIAACLAEGAVTAFDAALLGEALAALLHGLSVQARDGADRSVLLGIAEIAASLLPAAPESPQSIVPEIGSGAML